MRASPESPTWRSRSVRVVAYLSIGVLGAAVGVAGAFVQARVVHVGPVPIPVGLMIALGGCAGLFVGGATLMRSRLGAAAGAGPWLLAVLVLANARPEGDVVLAQALTAYGYLFLGAVLGAVSAIMAGARPGRPQMFGSRAPTGRLVGPNRRVRSDT